MRTIAIINQKGGCGKTTVSINLAAILAAMGRRTLLVDMDPQSHCALGLAVPEAQVQYTIADLLRRGLDGSLALSDLTWQVSRHLDLAPSAMALAAIEQELASAPDKDRRLAQVLSTVVDEYDFCIVDCPPSIGLLTFNALRAADEVLVPVETGFFSMQGAIKQEATIQMLVRRTGHQVRHRVLPTMYDVRTRLAREILSHLRQAFGDRLLPIVINFNSKLKEAASFGQPITEYDPGSRGMQDFERLAQWLIQNPPLKPAAMAEQTAAAANPALSRAAELVERARALAARTNAMASRIASDPHVQRTGAMHEAAPAPVLPPHKPGGESVHTPAGSHPPRPVIPAPLRQSSPAPTGGTPAPAAMPQRLPLAALAARREQMNHGQNHSHGHSHSSSQPQTHAHPGGATLTLVSPGPTRPASPRTNGSASRVFGVRQTTQGMLFVQPAPHASCVSVAGDFNNWSTTATPLQKDERLGLWQACIPVPPGRYRYRLVIDGQWEQDKYNAKVEANAFGEVNNVLEVAE